MSELPLVTVIIPSFNHESYIEQAIHSVLDQTYGAVELIVIDDASADRTPEIGKALAQQFGFTFFRNDKNVGLNTTLEKALGLSNGCYISILSSDDWLVTSKLWEQVDLLTSKDWDAVYGTGWVVEDGCSKLVDLADLEEPFADGTVLERLYVDSSHAPLLQSALIRRECLMDLRSERRLYTSDDWVMLIRLVERYRVGFVNRPWFYYRQHSGNTYRNYWRTLPHRVEVISEVTPEGLRAKALANVFRDQAQYLYMDGKRGQALRFLCASMMLYPSLGSWMALGSELIRRLGRRTVRRLKSSKDRSAPA